MERVGKAQWLDAALDVLESDGVDGVRVEALAKRLGISKSGFYWHFRNRDELLKNMLEYWIHEVTEVIANNPKVEQLDPVARLTRISEMIHYYRFGRYEMPIRQWALRDAQAAKFVRRANRMRTDFVSRAFSELGFIGEELQMRTMLFVSYVSLEDAMFPEISRKRRRNLIARRIALLTKK